MLTVCFVRMCAQFYREVIRAEVEGRAYTPPAPSATTQGRSSPMPRAGLSSASGSRGSSKQNLSSMNNNHDDDWGDGWNDKPSGQQTGNRVSCAAASLAARTEDV